MKTVTVDDAWANLGNAVVEKAADDYEWALFYLATHKRPKSTRALAKYLRAEAMKQECEEFFKSEHFNTFSDCDGVAIMEGILRKPRFNKKAKYMRKDTNDGI